MSFVIVPNVLRDQIYALVDAEIAKHPDAAVDREVFYQTVLNYYDMHGELPEISLRKTEPPADQDNRSSK